MVKKHDSTIDELNKPYEENVVGVGGIVKFSIGLFLLIVITFALMALLVKVLEDDAKETKSSTNPMAMTDRERLPPEPRVQLAPGFGVDVPGRGRVNLELSYPQSEYVMLSEHWKNTLEHGQKDAATGAVTILPIDEAKEIFLRQNPKARADTEIINSSRQIISDASSGRMATGIRK